MRIIGKDRIIEKGNSLEGGKGEVRVLLSKPLFSRNNTNRSNEASVATKGIRPNE